jgi:CubicO group peptidase (beta-lactamase class C family)
MKSWVKWEKDKLKFNTTDNFWRDTKMIKTGFRYFIIMLTGLMLIGCNSTGKVASPVKADPKDNYISQGKNMGPYWPTNGWKTCSPEAVGMDSDKLFEAMEYAAEPMFKTKGIVVIKNGYIVAESYFGNVSKDSEHMSYSMAKSFTSALVGIAIDKGMLASIDEKLCQYYEDWDCNDPEDLRSKITIRHALTLTTGLKWEEDWSKEWNFRTNDALKMGFSGQFHQYMSQRPGIYEPGSKAIYSTGDPMLLSRVFQEACGMTAFDFADQNLFAPLNIKDIRWDMDKDGYTSTHGGLYTSVRSYAKFGLLFLNKGKWEDKQVVSEQWVEKSTQTDPSVNMWNYYSYLWHVNLPVRLAPANLADNLIKKKGAVIPIKGLPADAYMAAGILGQYIIIIPSKDMIIVRVANQRKARIDLVKLIKMVIKADKG